jgi:hypothetical protein
LLTLLKTKNMAKITAKGLLSGGVGPVAYRMLNGQGIVQSRPGKGGVKQTKSTKESASEFGNASAAAKAIRMALFPILQSHTDHRMHIRFTAKVFEAATANTILPRGSRTLKDGDLSMLDHFQFNTNSLFSDYCTLQPDLHMDASGQLVIDLPEFSPNEVLAFPYEASGCDVCYMVSVFDPISWQQVHAEVFRVTAAKGSSSVPAQEFQTAPVAAGHVVIVTAAILFVRNNNLMGNLQLNSKVLHPCEIVEVIDN